MRLNFVQLASRERSVPWIRRLCQEHHYRRRLGSALPSMVDHLAGRSSERACHRGARHVCVNEPGCIMRCEVLVSVLYCTVSASHDIYCMYNSSIPCKFGVELQPCLLSAYPMNTAYSRISHRTLCCVERSSLQACIWTLFYNRLVGPRRAYRHIKLRGPNAQSRAACLLVLFRSRRT